MCMKRWLKRGILALIALGWIALALSDYAILVGRRSMSYGNFVEVQCRYWTGLRPYKPWKRGPEGSDQVRCPAVIKMEKKR